MTYQETLTWMFGQLPMYQRQGKSAFKKDLKNIAALAAELNHPEKQFKTIHVAGTNGKGSVSHMLASIFQEAGYKTGLYTSPHLKDYRERIRINGDMIPEDAVTHFIADNKSFLEAHQLSFFEMSVGLAFNFFAQQKVDIAIIETGLGGRLDSTNIITPELSVITNIGFDHMQMLGDTLAKIAGEKAGIIKPHVPVVIGEKHAETTPVFIQKAESCKSPIHFAQDSNFPDYESDLKGSYQIANKRTVLKAIETLIAQGWHITPHHIKNGLRHSVKNTGLRGRWQELGQHPKTVCDTGHNKEGLQYVLQQITDEEYKNLRIVLGVVNDKDLDGVLPLFPKTAIYYFCKANIPRGLDATILAEKADKFGLKGKVYNSVQDAYKSAQSDSSTDDFIYIGGSTFTVAEVI